MISMKTMDIDMKKDGGSKSAMCFHTNTSTLAPKKKFPRKKVDEQKKQKKGRQHLYIIHIDHN